MSPDTPFAELLRAVQSGATHITWRKSRPISDSERADAKKAAKRYLMIALVLLLVPIAKLGAYFGYFPIFEPQNPPRLLADRLFTLLLLGAYAALPIYFFTACKHARKIAKHPAAQSFPVRYTLQTKASFQYRAKGIFAALGDNVPLNWQKFTATEWAEILPAAGADEAQSLSQIITKLLI